MFDFIIVVAFICLVFLIIYLPAFHQVRVAKRSKKKFINELNLLDNLIASSLIIKTEKLGLGESQNSDITFGEAMQNQRFAVNSILGLLHKTAEK